MHSSFVPQCLTKPLYFSCVSSSTNGPLLMSCGTGRFWSVSVIMWKWPKLRITTGEQTSPGRDCRLQIRCVCVMDSHTPPTGHHTQDQSFYWDIWYNIQTTTL